MSLKEMLAVKYPIIQGGMARISKGVLASSVANAGGLGLVGTGGLTTEEFTHELQLAREMTKEGGVFGANIVLMEGDVEAKIQAAIDAKVAVIVLAAGNPKPWVQPIKDEGILVFCVVGNAKMAKKSEELGADAIIIEGLEAGGHIGNVTTMSTLPQVVEAVNVPVIAAGGIATGGQILAAQIMGASGVQMGTRFLVADETPIHDNFKDAIVAYEGHQTDLTGSPHAVRQLSNKMTQEYIRLTEEGAPAEEIRKVYAGSLSRAVYEGDVETGSMMAGISVGLVHKRDSMQGIFNQLISEYQEAKQALAKQEDFLY